nr:retrovirus-related Pol polyprotein from transposon TNT 1-94 [Tanacetum cinerariifolium]
MDEIRSSLVLIEKVTSNPYWCTSPENTSGSFTKLRGRVIDLSTPFSKARPGLGIMKHTKPKTQDSLNKSVSETITVNETKSTIPLVPTEVKNNEQESKLNELTKLVQMLMDEKIKTKTHEQKPESSNSRSLSKRHIWEPIWYMDSECSKSMTGVKSYLHKHVEQPGPKDEKEVSDDEEVTQVKVLMALDDDELVVGKTHAQNGSFTKLRGRVIDLSTPFSKARPGLGIIHVEALYTPPQTTINLITLKEMDSGCSRSMIGVKSYLHKYAEQPGPKVVFGDNSSCTTEGYGLINREVIDPNEQDNPETEDVKGPPYTHNTKNVQNKQINHQFIKENSRNNIEALVPIIESLVPKVIQSQNTNHISTSSHPAPQDRWSKDKHVKLVNIIGDPGEGMLTRSMAAKLTAASTSECLFADFLYEIEPKKVFEALKHPGWVDAMQEELNQFYRNKVWTLVLLPHGKITIGSKWVFRNKKDEHGIVTKNKARLVAQGYSHEEGINYDETFARVARIEAIKIFLAFATYMDFIVFQMDVKSAFVNEKLKEEVNVKQPPGFESSKFLNYVCKLDKALYRLKQAPGDDKEISICQEQYTMNLLKKFEIFNSSLVKTLMVPLNNLGLDLADYAGCNMDRKSTSGACQILSGKLVCWSAKKQHSMVPIFYDYTSAIAISNNPVLHSRTKHIDIRYHFITDHILKGDIELHFILTEYQLAGIFTKPLDEPTFARLKAELCILNID